MEDNIKPYPKYKEIDVPWLPTIPDHWNFDKLKYCFAERVEKGYPDEQLLSSTQTRGVIPQSLYGNRVVSAQKDLHLLKLVEVDDFVISLRSFQGGIEYAHYRGIISPAYTVMKANDKIETPYFKYLAKSIDFIQLLQTCVTGIREGQNIDYKLLKKNYLPIPPNTEQTQISNFLDYKVALINKFIKDKKREIKLLKEQIEYLCFSESADKQIIRSWETAFNPSWKKIKAKRIFDEKNIKNCPNEELLAVTQDRGVVFKKDCSQNYVSPTGSLDGLKLVQNGDFVISLRSFQGGIEYSFCQGIVSPAYNVFALKPQFESEELKTYFRFLFKTKPFIELLKSLGGGIRDGKNISFSEFAQFEMAIPSDEQLKTILKLSKVLDTLQANSTKLFAAMNEYKTSLISDVVTGKVDVRNVAVEKLEDIPEEEPEEVEESEELENNEE